MNVDDVKEVPPFTDEAIFHIYTRQAELMDKYHEIEKLNGFPRPDVPVDLDDRFGQALLKDFAWRVTEELTESTEALDIDLHHAREEAADALHFLIELFILVGFPPQELANRLNMTTMQLLEDNVWIQHTTTSERLAAYACVEELGKAMNCLKQKAWKQTHVLTDHNRFHNHLALAFVKFCEYCATIKHTPESLFNYYFKKSEVNKFRQRSAY
jgi:hypothetical protein